MASYRNVRIVVDVTPPERGWLREHCAACGHGARPSDPWVTADGWQIHQSHTTDPASGFYAGH